MLIKGLLFDFDGLILDTELPEFQVWEEIYNFYGVKMPMELWLRNIGTTNDAFDVLSYLEENAQNSVINRNKILEKHRKLFNEKMSQQKSLPGVVDYIIHGKSKGIKLAVASSSPMTWLEKHLGRINLLNEFDVIVSSNDVSNVKPSPEIYNLALKRMKIDPENAIAFEDSQNGIIAAKSAGIFCVAVPNVITEHLDLSQADLTVTSLATIHLDQLVKLVAQKSVSIN